MPDKSRSGNRRSDRTRTLIAAANARGRFAPSSGAPIALRPSLLVAALITGAWFALTAPRALAGDAAVESAAPDPVGQSSTVLRPLTNAIEELTAHRRARGTSLTIRLQRPLQSAPSSRVLTDPPRIVLELPAATGGYGADAVSLTDGPLQTVDVVRSGAVSQVILVLRHSLSPQIALDGAALNVLLAEPRSSAREGHELDAVDAGGGTDTASEKRETRKTRATRDGAPLTAQATTRPAPEPLLLAANTVLQGAAAAPTRLVESDAARAAGLDAREVPPAVVVPPSPAVAGNIVFAATPLLAQSEPAPPASSVEHRGHWELRASDVKLSTALERWARDAGWRLSWEAERDFDLVLQASFAGTFEQALNAVLRAYVISDFPLQACLHEDHDGNRAVRVFRFGEHKSCD